MEGFERVVAIILFTFCAALGIAILIEQQSIHQHQRRIEARIFVIEEALKRGVQCR